MKVRIALISFCTLLALPMLEAKHIIGGEIYYTCEGIDARRNEFTVRLTMKIYRDCGSDGADFDNPAEIGVYIKSGTQNFNFSFLDKWTLQSRKTLESYNPCVFTPPNICVEEGVYVKKLTLPILDRSYFIAYQRCCRNTSITNIVNPGAFGAAYTLEISPEAQRTCNNSPSFKNFPPILICRDLDINFDHSATDADNDSLVYEFCTPFAAGGQRGSGDLPGDPRACDGVTPDPSLCIPPFQTIVYKAPFYNQQFPMAGTPPIVLNPQTGQITGVPTNIGQYVVGICLKEYRNGVLLTVTQRDFQFNVINCRKNINASIISDSVMAGDQFIVNACGDKTVVLTSTSTIESSIKSYEWEFDLNGKIETFLGKSVSVVLPDLGSYTGKLYLNKGDKECSDTAQILINVFPGINADFIYQYDTCVAGPVFLSDRSLATQSTIREWTYLPEANQMMAGPDASYIYKTPGKKNVRLVIKDNNGCRDTATKSIQYYPVPALLVLNPSTFGGCQPVDIFFNNLSFPIDTTYRIDWDFGDGRHSDQISPTHRYTSEGKYSVRLKIVSPIGCETSIYYPDWIDVRKSPEAGFSCNPEKLSNLVNTVQITDESRNAEKIHYLINDLTALYQSSPNYTFRDTGIQTITQIVSRGNGCADTLVKRVDIEPIVTFFMPNAFTPGTDGVNDRFNGVGIMRWAKDFRLSIWDRWGGLIYSTEDASKSWNGQFDQTGDPAPPGFYIYTVSYTAPRGQEVKLKGYVTLIR